MTQRWFDNSRIAAISDGVFAIAMTLLVLDLKLPVLEPPVSSEVFHRAVIRQLPKFVSWIISFAILCRLWSVQHLLLKLNERKTRLFTVWNFIFLGTISFIPFPTSLISEHPDQSLSVVVFSLTILCAWATMLGMRRCYKGIDYHTVEEDSLLRSIKPFVILTPIVTMISFSLTFVKPQLGVWIWIFLPLAGRWVVK